MFIISKLSAFSNVKQFSYVAMLVFLYTNSLSQILPVAWTLVWPNLTPGPLLSMWLYLKSQSELTDIPLTLGSIPQLVALLW